MPSVCMFCQEIKIGTLPKIINILGRVERLSSKRKVIFPFSQLLSLIANRLSSPEQFSSLMESGSEGSWGAVQLHCTVRPTGAVTQQSAAFLYSNNQLLGTTFSVSYVGFFGVFLFTTLRPDLIFFSSLVYKNAQSRLLAHGPVMG